MYLQQYIWVFSRRLWLILLGVVLCTGATFVISSRTVPKYEAATLLQVSAPGTNNGNDVFSNQALAVSYALQVTNDDILQDATKALPGVTLAQLKQAVSASPADNTQLIQIRADAPTAQLAATIANTVTQVFVRDKVASETAHLQSIADQLSQQLVLAKANTDQAQKTLSSLQRSGAPTAEINHQINLLNISQVNYNSLLTNYNDIQLQKALSHQILTVVQLATPPDQPLGSRTGLNTAIAAAMSGLLMLVLVLLLDWMDVSIKTPEDVVQLARLEPLGSIPLYNSTSASHHLQPAAQLERGERAFAIISTNFNALNTGQRSVLVTSLHAGTGTTTVAAQLALSLAQSGIRVLLVDANWRRPSLHQRFYVTNGKGLANCLSDISILEKQPHLLPMWLNQWKTTLPNLWFLPAGTMPENSLFLLRSPELRRLIGYLLQTQESISGHQPFVAVDIIIFDTPALGEEEANTIALAPLCDSTVLVIEAGRERKETLKKTQTMLSKLGIPILGVVVNRQKATHRPYPYANQSQQPVAHNDNPPPAPSVKYPLLKIQTFASEPSGFTVGDTPAVLDSSLKAVPGRLLSQQIFRQDVPAFSYDKKDIVEQNSLTVARAEKNIPANSSQPLILPVISVAQTTPAPRTVSAPLSMPTPNQHIDKGGKER